MKSKQFCSVCKEWLDMEVVPTGDGDDDGVIWFRCPQCQGFLPKLSGADLQPESAGAGESAASDAAPAETGSAAAVPGGPDAKTGTPAAPDLPWDSPADMMAARDGDHAEGFSGATGDDSAAGLFAEESPAVFDAPATEPAAEGKKTADAEEPAEPIHEYAAMLAELDPEGAVPYRPWEVYEVGQCLHHLAWDDCGVVVAKENLPGGRQVIKAYFQEAGVVRLIEQAPR